MDSWTLNRTEVPLLPGPAGRKLLLTSHSILKSRMKRMRENQVVLKRKVKRSREAVVKSHRLKSPEKIQRTTKRRKKVTQAKKIRRKVNPTSLKMKRRRPLLALLKVSLKRNPMAYYCNFNHVKDKFCVTFTGSIGFEI